MEEMKLPEWMGEAKAVKYLDGIDVRQGFMEKNLLTLARFARGFVFQSNNAAGRGLL